MPTMNNDDNRTCKIDVASKQLGRETLARWIQENFHQWKQQPCINRHIRDTAGATEAF